MTPGGSVTHWLGQLQAGDAAAAQELWQRYFARLVGLARKKLEGTPRRTADEEDVALSAFGSFCRNAERGRFPDLQDRDGLWQLLVTITARKVCHLLRDAARLKRGGGIVADPRRDEQSSLDQIVGSEPTPEFAAQVAEECQRLLKQLGSSELEAVALWKMEGYSNDEIADKLNCAPRTVQRKLRLIRSIWEKGRAP
jgi:DNA-directed RNA polymerase specialized sigma24 family protein